MNFRLKCLALMSGVCPVSLISAADNPVAWFGTAGGSNERPFVFQCPYLFGNGENVAVKWKRRLADSPYGVLRGPAYTPIVFDERGDLYWRTSVSGAYPRAGIVKTRAADGSPVWIGPLTDVNFTSSSPIVSSERVYASCNDPNDPYVYALDRENGTLIWRSPALPKPVELHMGLLDGVLYGVTSRDATSGAATVFAVRATDGHLLSTLQVVVSGSSASGSVVVVPNAFGPSQHGVYWCYDANSSEALQAVKYAGGQFSTAWTSGPIRTIGSWLMFSESVQSLYACHWFDYGSAAEAYSPVTGTKRWTASAADLGSPFNGGFYPCHTLAPDGMGLLFGGFDGETFAISDPGSLVGAVTSSNGLYWQSSGPDNYGEPASLAVTIRDPATQRGVYVTGTRGWNTDPPIRRLRAIDSQLGSLLWEWANPNDVAPLTTGFNFRALSVGPDGVLYYFDAQEGPAGTLYAIGTHCVVDVDGDGFVTGGDFDQYVEAFESGSDTSDIDGDGFVTGADFDSFVQLFETGC